MTACKAADLEDHFQSRPLSELSAVSLVVMNESERYTKEISGPDQKSLFFRTAKGNSCMIFTDSEPA